MYLAVNWLSVLLILYSLLSVSMAWGTRFLAGYFQKHESLHGSSYGIYVSDIVVFFTITLNEYIVLTAPFLHEPWNYLTITGFSLEAHIQG